MLNYKTHKKLYKHNSVDAVAIAALTGLRLNSVTCLCLHCAQLHVHKQTRNLDVSDP